MKIGIRKPSYKSSFRAKTSGRATRSLKKLTTPGYGRKGTGFLKNPSKAFYNYGYSRTTRSAKSLITGSGSKKSGGRSKSYSYGSSSRLSSRTYKSSGGSFSSAYVPKSGTRSRFYSSSQSNLNSSYKMIRGYRINSDTTAGENYFYYCDYINRYDVTQQRSGTVAFEHVDNLFMNDVTSYFNVNYCHTVDENYVPCKLTHERFNVQTMQRKEQVEEPSKYLKILEDMRLKNGKKETSIRTIETLSEIPRKFDSYHECGPGFINTVPKGYALFQGVSYYGDRFVYDNSPDSNSFALYLKLKYQGCNRADFEIREENDKFHIYAYYEDQGELITGHIGYINEDNVNYALSLFSDIQIQVYDMLLDHLTFKIYVQKHEFQVYDQYKRVEREKKIAQHELQEQRVDQEDTAFQFVLLGVACENKGCRKDAILNYEKAIEIGYSVPFVYERLFLIYEQQKQDLDAARVLSVGIQDLSLCCGKDEEGFFNYKIACFETELEKTKKRLEKIEIEMKPKKRRDNWLTKVIASMKFAIADEQKLDERPLLKPLKYLSMDMDRKRFYAYCPKEYHIFSECAKFNQEVGIYGTLCYERLCKNKKQVDPKVQGQFHNKIKYGKNICMEFQLEIRKDEIYINSYFYENNSFVKCEIGFIENQEVVNELKKYKDAKIEMKQYDPSALEFCVYVK